MSSAVPLTPGSYYHIYNRGNNGENLFIEEANYSFFLKRLLYFCLPAMEIYSYCLLKNHFHLLIKVKNEATPTDGIASSNAISNQFRRFFISYSQAINKRYKRTGSLFEKPFHRKEITSKNYLLEAVCYIHLNPLKHGFVEDFAAYPYSSYPLLLNGYDECWLNTKEVYSWFGNRDNFVLAHLEKAKGY